MRTTTSDATLASQEDSPLKVSTWSEMTLKQVDGRMVELTIERFKDLLPGKDLSTTQSRRLKTFKKVKDLKTNSEHARYDPLCDIFNAVEILVKSANRWKIVADHPETCDVDHKPDLALYPDDQPHSIRAYMHEVNHQNPNVARCAWGWMYSYVEVKINEADAGFHFSPSSAEEGESKLLRETEEGRNARASFIKYVTTAMLRQHRTHYYSFYIAGLWARAFRWDRVGCIVSEPIDLRTQSSVFLDILYRLAKSNAWGLEDTVTLASADDIKQLQAFDSPEEHYTVHRDTILRFQISYPIYKVSCPALSIDGTDTKGEERTYLIGRHLAGHYSPVGRCTRGYVAYDLANRCMAFLKDQWRCFSRHTEIETYQRLHAHHVEYIATPVAGGDIDHHRTVSQCYLQDLPVDKRPVERVHTRLVTKEVGVLLEQYEDSVELLRIITHVIAAHEQAWKKAGILHRDVSHTNILIDLATGKGILNDWDLAKYEQDMLEGVPACEPAGISVSLGTLPFKSVMSLRYPLKPPEVADDIESFIYVIDYMAMRFHLHNASPEFKPGMTEEERNKLNQHNKPLASLVHHFFFDEKPIGNGLYHAGDYKYDAIKLGEPAVKLLPLDDTGRASLIQECLDKAYELLSEHYQKINFSYYERFKPKRGHCTRIDEGDRNRPNTEKQKGDPAFKKPRLGRRWRGSRAPQASSPLRPREGLDHEALYDMLASLFLNEDNTERDFAGLHWDKTYDHFINQGVVTYVTRKNRSGYHTFSNGKDIAIPKLDTIEEAPEPQEDVPPPAARVTRKSTRAQTAWSIAEAAARGSRKRKPTRRTARKGVRTKPAVASPQPEKETQKATASRKAEASRTPNSPRIATAVKADVTGERPATRRGKAKAAEQAPTRRLLRSAQKAG
ncbi:uncharacterized protein PHACADRAFT_92447 [Phanerochaete carnosa HHB-10118-sp]|uniref:Fungal-type protein kinase domain-containing protein n=1 Tax=Phanerochaete carnosa (strain HHB-10118-sp) TaxID=650164 RepID=K5WCR1_PHACS|nr:uncharacterized protein PHACADRAFT_92447 [Phanerochaete carnosa HHB-10118-sp]EKM57055.1 hypothetical protein PHACADRAFT_92447 [Phanerochaete carnosa HHB-10118-sp]